MTAMEHSASPPGIAPGARNTAAGLSLLGALAGAVIVVMPVAWKKNYGKGRVFYSSLGHRAAEFDNANMATILRRGINWAARD